LAGGPEHANRDRHDPAGVAVVERPQGGGIRPRHPAEERLLVSRSWSRSRAEVGLEEAQHDRVIAQAKDTCKRYDRGPRADVDAILVDVRALALAGLVLLSAFDWAGQVAALTHELASPDPERRRDAVQKLAELSEENARPLLLSALGDPDTLVRVEAARVL